MSGPLLLTNPLRLALLPFWLAALLLPWRLVNHLSEAEEVGAVLLLTYGILWLPYLLFSKRAWRVRVGRVLLASASIAIAWFAAEGLMLLRIVDYRVVMNTPTWEPWASPKNLLDDELLHVHRPYLHEHGWSLGGDICIKVGGAPAAIRVGCHLRSQRVQKPGSVRAGGDRAGR